MTLTKAQKARRRAKRSNKVFAPPSRPPLRPPGVNQLANRMARARITRGPLLSQAGMAFAKCSLDPLSSMAMRTTGVPDRYSGETLIVDHKMDITVTPNAEGSISLAILPTLPGALHVYCDGTATPAQVSGGFLSVGGNIVNISTVGGSVGYECIPFQEYVSSVAIPAGSGTALPTMNPYSAARARCVALAAEVIDKATTLSSSGDVTACQLPLRVGTQSIVGPAHPSGLPSSGVYWQRTVDTPVVTDSQATAVKRYVCGKPRDGLYAVATRSSPNWDMEPFSPRGINNLPGSWSAQTFATVTDDYSALTSGGTAAMQYYTRVVPPATGTDAVGWSWVDTSTKAVYLTLTGLSVSPPQPIRVVVGMCVEYDLQASSSVSKFVNPSPKEDQRALKLVSDAQSMMPAAVPSSHKESFFGNLLKLVGRGVRGVANAGMGPISQLAAGANTIVGAFVPEFNEV